METASCPSLPVPARMTYSSAISARPSQGRLVYVPNRRFHPVSLRRGGQQCLCLADEVCRVHGAEEAEGMPELVISLGPAPGPGEFLGGAKPREGSRPGCAHRVQRLGCCHELLVSQPPGGSGPGRIATG